MGVDEEDTERASSNAVQQAISALHGLEADGGGNLGFLRDAAGGAGVAGLGGVGAAAYAYGGRAAPGLDRPVTALQREALDFFKQKGWSTVQAAGIVANLTQESGMNHRIGGDGGQAYGLAQWHPDRQQDFQNFAEHEFGHSIQIQDADFQQQLAFVHYELTEGKEQKAGALLKQATDPSQAAAAVSTYYERPANQVGEAGRRAQLAENITHNIIDTAPPSGPPHGPNTATLKRFAANGSSPPNKIADNKLDGQNRNMPTPA